jgi:hypothetical protein
MSPFSHSILRSPISRSDLASLARSGFGDVVKAVVDVDRSIMAVGGQLHSDEEALLLADGSRQSALWGINLYPNENSDEWIEFDSMINVRPGQGNRGRDVSDPVIRSEIRRVVALLVSDV